MAAAETFGKMETRSEIWGIKDLRTQGIAKAISLAPSFRHFKKHVAVGIGCKS